MFHKHLKLHLIFLTLPQSSSVLLINPEFCQSFLTFLSLSFTSSSVLLNPKYFLNDVFPFLLPPLYWKPSSLIRAVSAAFHLIWFPAAHSLNGARVIFHKFRLCHVIFLLRAFQWLHLGHKIAFKPLSMENTTFHYLTCTISPALSPFLPITHRKFNAVTIPSYLTFPKYELKFRMLVYLLILFLLLEHSYIFPYLPRLSLNISGISLLLCK